MRESGVRGFFRGMSPALVMIAPQMGVAFAVYEKIKKINPAAADHYVTKSSPSYDYFTTAITDGHSEGRRRREQFGGNGRGAADDALGQEELGRRRGRSLDTPGLDAEEHKRRAAKPSVGPAGDVDQRISGGGGGHSESVLPSGSAAIEPVGLSRDRESRDRVMGDLGEVERSRQKRPEQEQASPVFSLAGTAWPMFAGAAAGISSKLAVFPLDTVKKRVQTAVSGWGRTAVGKGGMRLYCF